MENLVASDAMAAWQALKESIQDNGLTSMSQVSAGWCRLMWLLDHEREAGRTGTAMSDAAYRRKGEWFSGLLRLLIEQRNHQLMASRKTVGGYSQPFKPNLVWPADDDPRLCLFTRVTGSSAAPGVSERDALADFTNRRKELKFAAVDLKLASSPGSGSSEEMRSFPNSGLQSFQSWRTQKDPAVYVVWGARLGPAEPVETCLEQLVAMTGTYLDGAALVAWRTNEAMDGYEWVRSGPDFDADTLLSSIDARIAANSVSDE